MVRHPSTTPFAPSTHTLAVLKAAGHQGQVQSQSCEQQCVKNEKQRVGGAAVDSPPLGPSFPNTMPAPQNIHHCLMSSPPVGFSAELAFGGRSGEKVRRGWRGSADRVGYRHEARRCPAFSQLPGLGATHFSSPRCNIRPCW